MDMSYLRKGGLLIAAAYASGVRLSFAQYFIHYITFSTLVMYPCT